MEFLQMKWSLLFDKLDISGDGIINFQDSDLLYRYFDSHYHYVFDDIASAKVYSFMRCITFRDIGVEQDISKELLISRYAEALVSNASTDKALEILKHCFTKFVMEVIDYDSSGLLSFYEYAVFSRSVDVENYAEICYRFGLTCPDRARCHLHNLIGFYVEFYFGNDREFYAKTMTDYKSPQPMFR